MADNQILPHLDACVKLYKKIYDNHKTKTFRTEDIEWSSSELTLAEVLDFGVAYGIFSFNEKKYQLNCSADASDDEWEATLHNHADDVREVVASRLNSFEATNRGSDSLTTLTWQNKKFASIFINDGESFHSMVNSVVNVNTSGKSGVVLRSSGEHASQVQRFADQLCDVSEEMLNSIDTSFDKLSSDVVGSEKDSLEFRIYLQTT